MYGEDAGEPKCKPKKFEIHRWLNTIVIAIIGTGFAASILMCASNSRVSILEERIKCLEDRVEELQQKEKSEKEKK